MESIFVSSSINSSCLYLGKENRITSCSCLFQLNPVGPTKVDKVCINLLNARVDVQGGWGGWPTGNGKKLSSSQATGLAVAYILSISCGPSTPSALYRTEGARGRDKEGGNILLSTCT